MKYFFTSILLIVLHFLAPCQTKYQVGSSVVSIEPTDETVSLTLAGYAIPYLGRFTITWEDKGELPGISCITKAGEHVYAIDTGGKLYRIDKTTLKPEKQIGDACSIRFIAGFNDMLYGIDYHGEIMVCDPSSQHLHWKKIDVMQGITSFAASESNLYAATANGELLMGSVSGETVNWEQVGEAKDIVSMACDKNRLYAVTKDNVLLQRQLRRKGEEWKRIGYCNDQTYTIDIKHIIHINGKLHALTVDQHICMSKHSTEGTLSARAMAIKKGKDAVVIVSVDVCGFDHSFTNDIKKEISNRKGIPAEAIMINASHTHFAPVTQKWLTWEEPHQVPDSLYLNGVIRKGIILAIEQALEHTEPSYLSFGRDTTNIGRNRRNLNVYDQTVDVLQAVSADGKNKTLIFLAGCHPVNTDPQVGRFTANANFPGKARNVIEKKTGIRNTLFLQACAGDINPKGPFRESGEKLAGDVAGILGRPLVPLKGDITFAMDSIRIPAHPWTKEQIIEYREIAAKKPEDGLARRNVRWADIMLDDYQKGTLPKYMPVYVQTLNIGDWKLVGLSREVTTEFGLAIKNIWPDKKVSVVAYANDVASYLATDPHIMAKNYEGYDSFFWYGQPSPFPLKVFDTVIGKIKENNK